MPIGAADIGRAGIPIVAATGRKVAIEVIGTRTVLIADVCGARVVVVAVGIDLNANRVGAIGASRAFRLVVDANVVLAALAPRAFVIRTAAAFRNTGIAGAALRCRAFAARAAAFANRATGVIAAAFRAAALVHPREAAFVLRFAEDVRVVTAELFAVAVTVATGVVAALRMGGPDARRVAAVGTALHGSWRGRGETDTLIALPGLLPRTGRRCRSRRGTPGGIDVVLLQRTADDSRASEPEQALEDRTPAGASGERLYD